MSGSETVCQAGSQAVPVLKYKHIALYCYVTELADDFLYYTHFFRDTAALLDSPETTAKERRNFITGQP